MKGRRAKSHMGPRVCSWPPGNQVSRGTESLTSSQFIFPPPRLWISLFFLFGCALDPRRGWKWRIKTKTRENSPSCNRVSERCSPPITTLLDKSLFSLHTVSLWCYHFSLNSIKSSLSLFLSLRSDENCTVLCEFATWGHILQYDLLKCRQRYCGWRLLRAQILAPSWAFLTNWTN